MTRFQETVEALVPRGHKDDLEPIKLAILDTGIDMEHPFIRAHMKRQAVTRNFADDGPEDSVYDTDGHGTLLSQFLLYLAPFASLYIAKVATGKSLFPSSVAKVTSSPLERRVLLILMAFIGN
jgi:Subtilase family